MGIWISTNLSTIWRQRTGALLPAIQILRFFLILVGPIQQTPGCNESCQFIPAEDLVQSTHSEQVCATGVLFWTWENSLACERALLNSEPCELFTSQLVWKQPERWMSKICQENRVAYMQDFLMFFFRAWCPLEVGSEVNLKRAGISLCSWESSLNLKQNFFLAEDGGVNKKYIRQTSFSAVISCFIHLRENKLLSLEMLFFSEAVTWQFSRRKKHMLQFFCP